jgi:hypothetical protein
LSVRPHRTTLLPLEVFTKFDIEYFSKIRREKFHYNQAKIAGTLHEDVRTFMIISLSILFRVRNILDKITE